MDNAVEIKGDMIIERHTRKEWRRISRKRPVDQDWLEVAALDRLDLDVNRPQSGEMVIKVTSMNSVFQPVMKNGKPKTIQFPFRYELIPDDNEK